METITTQIIKKYQYPTIKKLSISFAREINYIGVIIKQPCRFNCFVLKANTKIVGYCTGKKQENVLTLLHLFILPEYRTDKYKNSLIDFINEYSKGVKCEINDKMLLKI